MTKIVQVQYSIESAGRAAFRLQKAFLEAGIDSSILSLKYTDLNDERITHLRARASKIAEWDQNLQKRIRKNVSPKQLLYSSDKFST